MDYEKYEEEANKIRNENKNHLQKFEQWLRNTGITAKTVKKHIDNVDFYINEFLLYYDADDYKTGCYRISSFLGDWFTRKAMWASCGNIKSNAASIKKFYMFMLESGEIEHMDYNFLCETIKTDMPEWLENMIRFDEMIYDDF